TDYVRMFNKKPTKAKTDYTTVLPGSTGNVIDVLSNDNVAPPKTLTITGVTQGNNGGVSVGGGGVNVIYTPNAGFTGIDSFTYTVDDGAGGVSTGLVKVRVNTKPSLTVSNASVAEGNTGTSPALFTVTMSFPIDVP